MTGGEVNTAAADKTARFLGAAGVSFLTAV